MKIQNKDNNSFIKNIPKNIKIILLYGQDAGLINQYLLDIKSNFFPQQIEEGQYIQLFEEDIKEEPSVILEQALSVSLFGDTKKLIVVKEAKDYLTKIIKDYITYNHNDILLVLIASELTASSSLRKLCEQEDIIATIACYLDSNITLRQYIIDVIKNNQYTIDNDSINYLVNNLGNDRSITKNELDKLMLYTYNKKSILLQDVLDVVASSESVYLDKLIYSFFNNQKQEAYKYLLILLEDNHSVVIIRTLINHVQKIMLAKSYCLTTDIDNAIKYMKPPIFFSHITSFKQQVNKIDNNTLQTLLNDLLYIEIQAKTISYFGEIELKKFIVDSLLW